MQNFKLESPSERPFTNAVLNSYTPSYNALQMDIFKPLKLRNSTLYQNAILSSYSQSDNALKRTILSYKTS